MKLFVPMSIARQLLKNQTCFPRPFPDLFPLRGKRSGKGRGKRGEKAGEKFEKLLKKNLLKNQTCFAHALLKNQTCFTQALRSFDASLLLRFAPSTLRSFGFLNRFFESVFLIGFLNMFF